MIVPTVDNAVKHTLPKLHTQKGHILPVLFK